MLHSKHSCCPSINLRGFMAKKQCDDCRRARPLACFRYPCSSEKICRECVAHRREYALQARQAKRYGYPPPAFETLRFHDEAPKEGYRASAGFKQYPFDQASKDAMRLLNEIIAVHGQQWAAGKLKVTQGAISHWVNWRRSIDVDTVRAIKTLHYEVFNNYVVSDPALC